jgi:tetratricopeptide (TPR) repeat protein
MIFAIATAVAMASAGPAAAPCPDVSTSEALVCRALEAQKSGNTQGAAQTFEDAARAAPDKDPQAARLWAAAGNVWIAAGQPGRAAAALDRALELPGLDGHQRGEALLDRARAAEAQNDFKTARARVNEARMTISEDPFLWYFSAALAIREGDAATAQSSIGEALKIAPSDPTILFEAGHVAHFVGDDARARAYWEQAASADPNGATGKSASEALRMLSTPAASAPQAKPPAQPKS